MRVSSTSAPGHDVAAQQLLLARELGARDRQLLVDVAQRLRHVGGVDGGERRCDAPEQVAGLDARAERRHAACRRLVAALDRALHHAAEVGVGGHAPVEAHGAAWRSRLWTVAVRTSSRRCVGLGRKIAAVRPALRVVAGAGAEVGAVVVAVVGGRDRGEPDHQQRRQERGRGGAPSPGIDADRTDDEEACAEAGEDQPAVLAERLRHAGPQGDVVRRAPARRRGSDDQPADQEVRLAGVDDRGQHLDRPRLLQDRRRHLVGAVGLRLGLEGLAVERDLDGGRRHGRVVGGAVEVDDEHLALDDADELVALRDGDDARRGKRCRTRGRLVGVIVPLVGVGGIAAGPRHRDERGYGDGGKGSAANACERAGVWAHGSFLSCQRGAWRGPRGARDGSGRDESFGGAVQSGWAHGGQGLPVPGQDARLMPGHELRAGVTGNDSDAAVADEIHAAGVRAVRPAGLGVVQSRSCAAGFVGGCYNPIGAVVGVSLCRCPVVMGVLLAGVALMAMLAVVARLAGVRRRPQQGGKNKRERGHCRQQPCRPSLSRCARHSRSFDQFRSEYAGSMRKHQGRAPARDLTVR